MSRSKKVDNGKKRLELSKLKLEHILIIVGIIGGIVAALATVYQIFFANKGAEEARLEVVDFQIENNKSYPKISVKLRNTGGKIAYLKEARLVLKKPRITEESGHSAANVNPVQYNWLISLKDIQERQGRYPLSRKIDSNDADNLQFVLGFEKLKATLDTEFELELLYNNDQKIVMPLSKISIANSSGDFPAFIMSDSEDELQSQLKTIKTPYTIGQIIYELGKRKSEKSAYLINEFLRHDDTDVRINAAKYYMFVEYAPAVSNLILALRDNSADVRNFASQALVRQGEKALDEVSKLEKDNDPAIRELAADIIKRITEKPR